MPALSAVSCPHCNGKIAADPSIAGKEVGCPHCNGRVIMPGVAVVKPAIVAKPSNESAETAPFDFLESPAPSSAPRHISKTTRKPPVKTTSLRRLALIVFGTIGGFVAIVVGMGIVMNNLGGSGGVAADRGDSLPGTGAVAGGVSKSPNSLAGKVATEETAPRPSIAQISVEELASEFGDNAQGTFNKYQGKEIAVFGQLYMRVQGAWIFNSSSNVSIHCETPEGIDGPQDKLDKNEVATFVGTITKCIPTLGGEALIVILSHCRYVPELGPKQGTYMASPEYNEGHAAGLRLGSGYLQRIRRGDRSAISDAQQMYQSRIGAAQAIGDTNAPEFKRQIGIAVGVKDSLQKAGIIIDQAK